MPPTMVLKGSFFAAGVWANAAVLVDKPQDWTSFDVCGKLRGALKVKKVSAPLEHGTNISSMKHDLKHFRDVPPRHVQDLEPSLRV